eukprot:1459099-Prymnesium_polylepis.1
MDDLYSFFRKVNRKQAIAAAVVELDKKPKVTGLPPKKPKTGAERAACLLLSDSARRSNA